MLGKLRHHAVTVAVAGITAFLVGGAPAIAHVTSKVGHLWTHIRPLADARYATQAEMTSEPWREVGSAGQPPFTMNASLCRQIDPWPCWSNFDGNHNTAAFFKDPFGVVHLKGLVVCQGLYPAQGCQALRPIFTLPAGYRPARKEVHVAIWSDNLGRLSILPDGTVYPEFTVGTERWISLDGVTFKAA